LKKSAQLPRKLPENIFFPKFLDIYVEAEGSKPVDLSVEVDLVLSETAKGIKHKPLVDEAVSEAFKAIETYLRKLT